MRQFKVNDELINKIKRFIKSNDNEKIIMELNELHYADLAEIFELLEIKEVIFLVKIFDKHRIADALAEIDEDLREIILDNLSAKEIAEKIEELDTDDATDVISELPEDRQERVFSQIKDSELTDDIKELLKYNENTAGGLMAKELVKVSENLSIAKCIDEIRKQAKDVTRVHSIYVVDSKNRLKGRLSLKDVVTAKSKSKVKDIFIPKVDFVTADQEGEEVAKIMSKYDLEAIPVTNKRKTLLGRITIDDIVDLIKDEAEKDYQLAAGISSEVEVNDSILQLTKARLPWLFLGLLGGLGSVFILKDFEQIMNQPDLRNLFFYTPLIAAMAGNVGVQSSAIIVQGLANDLVKGSLLTRLFKEVSLSLINGLALSIILVIFGQIVNQDLFMSLTIAGSMMGVIIIAALVGTFVPIILDRQGIDPAIATGPFITTANDIFGIFLFFYIAQLSLGF
ncbi:magnesium transporter [Flavobacteriaceae bacterium]|jgi:magnesium transporter|nr:magnesium transporter [Cryomorphaceae bacterium]MDB3967588.1 magnesium transporter [Flavobacteriaceae bacterium]MBT3502900.1 magnesium transporter [Cryomorphaceae bacterium]MBT3688849.1 magnesium transporter [Cryomorphaceae bacterium]MBT4221965.1 magnesium transporter [Cryomorphaceae bacterium]